MIDNETEITEFIKENFEPVEDKPGYVWFSKRNLHMFSIETLATALKSEQKCTRDLEKLSFNGCEEKYTRDLKKLSFTHNGGEEKNEKRNEMTIEDFFNQINEFNRQMLEEKERTLVDIITKYDFIVGSKELKVKLTEVLPKGVKIVYSPYIENDTTVFAVKKFDAMDLLREPYKAEIITHGNCMICGKELTEGLFLCKECGEKVKKKKKGVKNAL